MGEATEKVNKNGVSASLDLFTKLILHAIEKGKEDGKRKNRNETFDNGFIDGVLSITQLLMECLSSTGDLAELEVGLEGFHRAAHLLFGEYEDKKGRCPYLSMNEKDRIENLITQGLKKIGLKVKVFNVPLDENISPEKMS